MNMPSRLLALASLLLLSGCELAGAAADNATQEQIAALTAQIESLQAQLDENSASLATIEETTLVALNASVVELNTSVADNSAQIVVNADATAQTSTSQGVLASWLGYSEDGSEPETGFLAQLSNSIVGLEADLENATSATSQNGSHLGTVALDISALQLDLTGLTSTVATLNSSLGALDTSVVNLGSTMTTMDTTMGMMQGTLGTLDTELEALDTLATPLFDYVSVDASSDEIYFVGANINIHSGSGETSDGGSPTGLGNLVIGYNEDATDVAASYPISDKSGSHNLVVGMGHSYTSTGGFVSGKVNRITGPDSAILGGRENEISGASGAISGGRDNEISGGHYGVIAGGDGNEISGGSYGVVAGGTDQTIDSGVNANLNASL